MARSIEPLGIVAIDENGQYIYIPMKSAISEPVKAPTMPDLRGTGVVSPPNPEDFKTSQAQETDYSVSGRIKKNQEREKENEMPA